MFDSQPRVKIKEMFANADALTITAGAGMGIDSGLPDFRGNQVMWQAYPALAESKMSFTSIANPAAFWDKPTLAWGFYGHRLKLYREVVPHSCFYQLKHLTETLNLPYFIFTSNVDGQFQKAGFSEDFIYECHGSIHHLQCLDVCEDKIWSAQNLQPRIDQSRCEWLADIPRCPTCSGLARPNILMFDDYDWIQERSTQQYQKLQHWLAQYQRPVVIEIGAGTMIPTVRNFSESFAPSIIRINPRESEIKHKKGVAIAENAVTAIQGILDSLEMHY